MCEVKPAVLQTEVHPYFQEKELKQFLSKEYILIQSWYPLGHGDKALLEEPLFSELGRKYGKSNAQIILRWHIQDGNVVIPGSKNPAHIRGQFRSVRFFSNRRGNGENRGHGQKDSLLYQHPGNAESMRKWHPMWTVRNKKCEGRASPGFLFIHNRRESFVCAKITEQNPGFIPCRC